MKYVGLQQQISANNRKSVMLLLAFPLLILASVFAVIFFLNVNEEFNPDMDLILESFIMTIPIVLGVTAIWFLIAYYSHSALINMATGSKTLERKDNMRVYNLVENLCMSKGMTMPKVNIIESSALNAFASGLNQKTFTVTLTRGIIDELNDEELEGVIAHELMHIRNNDVKLLIITIIFVGIFSFLVQVAFRSVLYGGLSNRRNNKSDGKAMIIILVVALVAYLLSILFKFSLSRKREYLADSGAAEMTRNPRALASALRKISGNHHVDDVKSEDVQQMFIENSPKDSSLGFLGSIGGLFSTHPPIEKRIKLLEQF